MIKHMDWFLALLGLVVISLISNNYTEILTPQLYMLNTYLYIILAIIIVATSWGILDNNPGVVDHIFNSPWHFVGLVILTFVALFCVVLTPNENVVAKHAAWALFIITLGVISYITYLDSKTSGNFMRVGVILIVMVAILSWIAYSKPLDYFDSWGEPLLTMLAGLIIIELVDLAYVYFVNRDINAFLSRSRIYSWIAIILFSGFLVYDTQKLRQHAIEITEKCVGRTQAGCVDYCTESLGIFLDILNLFQNINNVSR